MKNVAYIEEPVSWQNSFRFFIPITIRFSETDMFGHMNNVSPFIYFEQARIELLKEAGVLLDDGDNSGVPVVGDLQCDFHKQLYFDDKVRIYVKAQNIGTTSIDIHYMAVNESEEVCLTGRGRLVFINASTGKPVPLISNVKQKLKML
ncbi:MAG TPA: thioesterase family protein [Bacillota bacterium]|nr:thioesterase family protein [Bacillota bacterium]